MYLITDSNTFFSNNDNYKLYLDTSTEELCTQNFKNLNTIQQKSHILMGKILHDYKIKYCRKNMDKDPNVSNINQEKFNNWYTETLNIQKSTANILIQIYSVYENIESIKVKQIYTMLNRTQLSILLPLCIKKVEQTSKDKLKRIFYKEKNYIGQPAFFLQNGTKVSWS